MKRIAIVFSFVVFATAAHAAAPFPLVPGEAVITCFSDNNPNAPVVAAFDIRNTASAPGTNQNWAAPAVHLPSWNSSTFGGGEVFGVALDTAAQPNIYLTSTSVYTGGVVTQATPGTGQVYKINGSSGIAASLGAPLLNSNHEGLGNVAYDPAHNQLFVTNFGDGRIYRIDPVTGAVKSRYDPFTAYSTGTPSVGERVWGVGVFQNQVIFGRWSPSSAWSVALQPSGEFAGAVNGAGDYAGVEQPLNLTGLSMPIADIAFKNPDRMLVAERGMSGTGFFTVPHQSRVIEYRLASGSWVASTNTYSIGVFNGTNSAGGAAFACPVGTDPAHVVVTGDALHYQTQSPDNIYGMQIFPDTGGSILNSYLIDADGNTSPLQSGSVDKTQIGDVDVYNTCDAQCFESKIIRVLCAADGTGDYFVTFTLKNLTIQTIYYAYITGLSPAGATANPNFINLSSTPVAPGGSVTIGPIRIHGAPPGALSFTVSIHNKDLEECCASRVTVDLPHCECAQVTNEKGPFCTLHGTSYTYTFTVQNLFNGPVSYVLLTPDTPASTTFSNYVFDLSSNPMAMGASRTFSVTIGGVAGGQNVCFRISLHNANFVTCCSILQCVTVPRCIDWTHEVVTGPGTTASINGDWLVLTNPDGKPDCAFPLAPEDTGFDLHWLPIATASLAPGAFIEQRVIGTVDGGASQTLTTMRTVRTAGGAELRTAFPALGSTRYTYEFYREGALIGRQTGVGSDVPAIANQSLNITTDAHFSTSGVPASQESGTPCDGPGAGCLFDGYTFKEVSTFAIASGPTYNADEVRVIPEDGRLTSTIRLSALGFHAEALRQVTLTELTVRPDRGDATGTTTTSLNTNAADWQVVAPGAERPAQVVTVPPPGWPAPFTGSQWISTDTTGFSLPGTTLLAFQRCFCLGSSGAATLDLQIHADNEVASVLLNGHLLAGSGGAFSAAPLTVRRAGTIGDGFFVAGRNCLRVEVNDFGGYTGVNAAGTVVGPTCLP